MATIAPVSLDEGVFPLEAVVKALVDDLILVATAEAQVRGMALPSDRPGIMVASVPMDSLSVVATLIAVENILKFELKESMVRTGGYDSIQAAVNHLVPRIQVAWDRKKGHKK
jgi:hypothetical protein